MSFYPVQPLPDTNARQATMTIRPPSTSLLAIDSEDRYKSYTENEAQLGNDPAIVNVSPYYFEISKAESLMNGFFTRVGVSEVQFPWGIPNINAKTQSMFFSWIDDGEEGQIEIVIQAGFYTPTALAAAVQAAVRARANSQTPGLLAAFTMTYGLNGAPQFAYATNSATQIAFQPLSPNSVFYPFPATQKQLFNVLGFGALNTAEDVAAFGGYTFCQYTRYIDIVCSQLTNNQALKDQMSQVIARDSLCRLYLGDGVMPGNIPCTEPQFAPPGTAPFTIYRNFATPKQIQWLPNQPIPGYLRFEVFDDSGASLTEAIRNIQEPSVSDGPTDITIDQGVYLDWSMTMLVSEN